MESVRLGSRVKRVGGALAGTVVSVTSTTYLNKPDPVLSYGVVIDADKDGYSRQFYDYELELE